MANAKSQTQANARLSLVSLFDDMQAIKYKTSAVFLEFYANKTQVCERKHLRMGED